VAVCRLCGEVCPEEDLLAVQHGGGCQQCKGSPACSRCGHARRQHRGTFTDGPSGCTAQVSVEDTLAIGRCGCVGYTTERHAFEENTPVVDVVTPQLRAPTDSVPANAPRLAHVRDVFDEDRRLRDLSE
jgi:hypothetical protein